MKLIDFSSWYRTRQSRVPNADWQKTAGSHFAVFAVAFVMFLDSYTSAFETVHQADSWMWLCHLPSILFKSE